MSTPVTPHRAALRRPATASEALLPRAVPGRDVLSPWAAMDAVHGLTDAWPGREELSGSDAPRFPPVSKLLAIFFFFSLFSFLC